MNLPNLLTVSRMFLTIIFAMFAQAHGAVGAFAALGFFALAALTDLADGYIARKYGLVTVFGKIMDPIADKCLILTALFIFSFQGMIALWMVIAVACREILVTVVRVHALTSDRVMPAEAAGKVKAAFQMTAIVLALVYRWGAVYSPTEIAVKEQQFLLLTLINGVMMVAVVLTLWSGWVFFKALRKG